MRLLLLALCTMALLAGDTSKPLPEVNALRLENILLRLDKLRIEQRIAFVDACRSAGIEASTVEALAKVCTIDLEKRTITHLVAPTDHK